MPIVAFQNYRTATLRLVIEPKGDSFEIPHLATAGIRYSLEGHSEDRSTSVLGDDSIEFWCDAGDVEVDIVRPSAISRLLWDICVNLGFCGGLVDGEPTHVLDLLPPAGPVTAAMFAELVVAADGAKPEEMESLLRRWRSILEAKFIEELGASVVPAETLKKTERRPFDPADPD